MDNKGPHISIKSETLFTLSNFHVTNTYVSSLIIIVLFLFLAVYYRSQITKNNKSKLFYLLHFAFQGIYTFFKTVVGDRISILFTLVGSLFVYIMLSNWFGLLPGVGSVLIRIGEGRVHESVPLLRGSTTDLNVTLALAFIAFFSIQYYGFKELGVRGYLGKFFNFSNPISFVVGILEVISEFSRIISFSFRLFGNIFAGEVMIAIIAFLVPVLASFPFLILEVFVGFIQGFVFAMLTAVFINLAVQKAEH